MLLRTICCWPFLFASSALADDFDLYTNSALSKLTSSDGATQVEKVSLAEILRAKPVLANENASFLVVRTDDANWAKLLVRQSIRKQGDGEVPIVHIQRFHCLRPGTERGRLAAGKDVYLFDGFQFNLDIGQVVPDGGGGDIEFRRDGKDGFLLPVGKAKLFRITKPLVAETSEQTGPSAGPVVPEDFAGNFRLLANGKWSGRLIIHVTKSSEVVGSYVSDQTGADYPVKGFVARPAHHIKFNIELPMAKQEFDGHLWTQGKNVFAGTMTLLENQFGFVAVREETELMPKEE